jgi:hypothetical protein
VERNVGMGGHSTTSAPATHAYRADANVLLDFASLNGRVLGTLTLAAFVQHVEELEGAPAALKARAA